MAARMRAHDWAASALGAAEGWPQTLATAVRICLTSRFPMVVLWGPDLRFFYNDAYLPLLGDKHPALAKPTEEIWGEIWHIIGPMLEGVMATGAATWSDDLLLPMDRHGYWEETYWTYSYSPLHLGDGSVGGVFTAVTDTTTRVLAERRLAALKDLGGQTGLARGVDEACELAVASLGRDPADVPFAAIHLAEEDGLRLAASSLPEHASAAWPLAEVIRDGRAVVVDDLLTRFGELPRGPWTTPPREAMVLPLRGEVRVGALILGANPGRMLDDAYRSFFGLVGEQIAALIASAQAYEAQRLRAEKLAELDRAKTAFFSNVSHEFRTPLTLMLSPLEELLASEDHPRLHEELAVIHRNGLRLLKLVNTLLDFSRIEAGRAQASYEPVDLAAFTAELASVFRAAVERAGLRLRVACPPLGEPVHVDRDMWEKVVLNLLSNALKHTFRGEIEVRLAREGDEAVLRVRDTGTGIAAEELPRLFERFHRIPGARARSAEGTGIGLALVQELVSLHAGTIAVDSQVGVGSTFTVRLPFGSGHLPAERISPAPPGAFVVQGAQPFVQEALRWLLWAGDEAEGPRLRETSGRVLIVDDNADMREYLEWLLRPRYAVRSVSDGHAALRAARAELPELVLKPTMMPSLDGIGLVKALREDPRTARIPIVLLSARAGQEASVEGLDSGADDYLVKPFSASELLARVGAHLQLGRQRREGEERFHALADSTPALIWVADIGGRRTFFNRGWLEFTGRGMDDELGDGWAESVHPDDLDRCRRVFATAFAARQPLETEHRLRRHDGIYRWIACRGAPVDAGDRFAGFVGGCLDIHEQRQERERQTLLARVAPALDTATGVDERLARLVRLLVDQRLADLCSVSLRGDGQLVRRAWAAADPAREAVLSELSGHSPATLEVARSGRSRLLSTIPDQRSPDPADGERRRRLAARSRVIVPLSARGRILGVLTVARTDGSVSYDGRDLALVEEIGRRAGLAVDNARLFEEERATARRLRLLQEATADLSSAPSPARVAQVAIRHLGRLLRTPAVAVLELRDGRALELIAIEGWGQDAEREWSTMPLDASLPPTDAVREQRGVWLERAADWERDYPHLVETVHALGFQGSVALPLRRAGAVVIAFAEERRVGPADRGAAVALAEQ
ncbi:MAG: ATP-binding protein, partial [Egibacteraceae bacterium]